MNTDYSEDTLVEQPAITLFTELGYTPELDEKKCETVYQHVYDSYQGQGQSIYSVS